MANIDQINPDFAKAMMLAKRELPSFVYDAVQLEGINFTLPEVQTLLDGITVGGHKLSDQQVAINQGNAWRQLFNDLEQKQFNVSDKYAMVLHGTAAKEEALEWGCFRSGGVTIAGTTYLPPKAKKLSAHFAQMVKEYETINDIYDSAIFVFLSMARIQFFYDVNKRMGRFMMNGILLTKGYPAINVPVTRQLEFNSLMIDFYDSDDQVAMNAFLKSCLDPRILDIMSE
ncbi:MAG: Fic family protein [Pseudomonadales bacterium]|nr:Fic family protein [Pseudomonadales bacterium]